MASDVQGLPLQNPSGMSLQISERGLLQVLLLPVQAGDVCLPGRARRAGLPAQKGRTTKQEEKKNNDNNNPLDRASQVSVCAETFSQILHGTPPKAPYE